MVRLAVLSESAATEGAHYFGEGLSERLFDTPVAIARLWRSHAYSRSMVISAEAPRDAQGRVLGVRQPWRKVAGNRGSFFRMSRTKRLSDADRAQTVPEEAGGAGGLGMVNCPC